MSRSSESVPLRGGRVGDLPEAFWDEALSAEDRLLLIDYDGTLAPFRIDPLEARPSPGVARRLARIVDAGATRVAVISGRPVKELRRLLDVERITLVGEHGWEMWDAAAGLVRHPLPPALPAVLDAVARAALQAPWGRWLERKRASLVLHTRGQPEDEGSRAEAAFVAIWMAGERPAGLRIQPIDGGVELRATDRDKGSAVRDLMSTCPAGTWPLYLGDEWTDEDAFRALAGRGAGIRVGVDERPSHARHRLAGPEDVAEFLRLWIERVEERVPTQAGGSS